MRRQTLILNYDYTPYAVTTWERAFVKVFRERMELIKEYDDFDIKSGEGQIYEVPSIVRLKKYIDRSKKRVPLSRKNLLIRDELKCCYCGQQFDPKQLTYDHVISRSQWIKQGLKGNCTNWENVVMACRSCNTYKGDSTLEKSGMRLLKQPYTPPASKYVLGFWPFNVDVPDDWRPYLSMVYKDI